MLKEIIASYPASAAFVSFPVHSLYQMHVNATKRSEQCRRLCLRSTGMQLFHSHHSNIAQLLKTKRWRIRVASLRSLLLSHWCVHSDYWLVCKTCCNPPSQDLLLMNSAGSNNSMIWSQILNSSCSPSWAEGQLSLLAQATVSRPLREVSRNLT